MDKIYIDWCCRLNICTPQKFICYNPIPNVAVSDGGPLRGDKVIRVEHS